MVRISTDPDWFSELHLHGHDGRLWHRVQQSSLTGEASRRRVLYFPAITGAYHPKNETSATPFYHKLAQIKDYRLNGKLNWSRLHFKTKN